jgi:hypothetical protein
VQWLALLMKLTSPAMIHSSINKIRGRSRQVATANVNRVMLPEE